MIAVADDFLLLIISPRDEREPTRGLCFKCYAVCNEDDRKSSILILLFNDLAGLNAPLAFCVCQANANALPRLVKKILKWNAYDGQEMGKRSVEKNMRRRATYTHHDILMLDGWGSASLAFPLNFQKSDACHYSTSAMMVLLLNQSPSKARKEFVSFSLWGGEDFIVMCTATYLGYLVSISQAKVKKH